MGLTSGTRLGPYEIVAPIGAGGMGEVYRGLDSRLGRTVAIKVLAPHLAASEEIRRRFEREGRTISQLSHPNICAVYDVGRDGDVDYLVMEHLEGETLAARLARGPMAFDAMLRCAAEIADALGRAHRAGIVHRDLKPGNVMLTASGAKLLDFGLARILEPVGDREHSVALTATGPLTEQGSVLGTVAYMAPEQLEGRPADTRADVFAFGAVVFEMATGRRAFAGDSRAALIVSVLSEEPPPISRLAPLSPPALERIVRTSLAKEPDARWQSMHDVALQLKNIAEIRGETPERGADGASARLASRNRARLPWLLVAALAASLAAAVVLLPRRSAAPERTTRFMLSPPGGGQFFGSGENRTLAIDPAGTRIAFIAAASGERPRIWMRPVSGFEAAAVAGTEGASTLFWAPDGRSIGFVAGGKLKRVETSGGTPVSLCDVRRGIGYAGSWGTDGQILFASVQGDALYRISSAGGTPTVIMRPDHARGEGRISWPWFLPDGRSFLYHLRRTGDSAVPSGSVMFSGPGGRREIKPLLSDAQFVDPGYLVFAHEGSLLAQRFDPSKGTISGDPFPLAESVRYFLSTGWAAFSASRSGSLVYAPTGDLQRLAWFDRQGHSPSNVGEPGGYLTLAMSPDGTRVLFDRTDPKTGTYDLWLLDVERGIESRVTSDPDTEVAGVWMPDGKTVIHAEVHGASPQLFRRDLETGKKKAVLPPGGFQEAGGVSPDGKTLVFSERSGGNFAIRTMSLAEGAASPSPLTDDTFNHVNVRLSPSGRHLLFVSNESGTYEAYVAPIDAVANKIRISSRGADSARWSADSREIYYLSGDGQLILVPVRTQPSLALGSPQTLFTLKADEAWQDFLVTGDGKRFLAIVPVQVGGRLPLRVVMNWTAETRPR